MRRFCRGGGAARQFFPGTSLKWSDAFHKEWRPLRIDKGGAKRGCHPDRTSHTIPKLQKTLGKGNLGSREKRKNLLKGGVGPARPGCLPVKSGIGWFCKLNTSIGKNRPTEGKDQSKSRDTRKRSKPKSLSIMQVESRQTWGNTVGFTWDASASTLA